MLYIQKNIQFLELEQELPDSYLVGDNIENYEDGAYLLLSEEQEQYHNDYPEASTMVFAATMKHQDAPGTTFKRHMKIARGLLSEDDYLLTEILFNPRTPHQIARIQEELDILQEIIKNKDSERMKEYLTKIRKNIE